MKNKNYFCILMASLVLAGSAAFGDTPPPLTVDLQPGQSVVIKPTDGSPEYSPTRGKVRVHHHYNRWGEVDKVALNTPRTPTHYYDENENHGCDENGEYRVESTFCDGDRIIYFDELPNTF